MKFQSSPGTQAGCYNANVSFLQNRESFNPHPAHRPGATVLESAVPFNTLNSFNPHPAHRPGATGFLAYSCWQKWVSILTRHTGRVLPASPEGRCYHAERFQSSPGTQAGCYFCGQRKTGNAV
jgi:hypothetical protein